jgi:hypothetical protein
VSFLRLRQVCLVSRELARDAARIESELGLAECHRDPNVAKYGLENVLFPVGTSFIEIVAPTREGTAAGRFLDRHRGRYGYMVILDCDDPERRQAHALSLGIRVANLIRHGSYLGVQLHPKDTGAAMIEFNRTEGGADPMGPYAPAGPHWQRAIRGTMARRLLAVEIECPDPAALAGRWGTILEQPVRDGVIELDSGSIRFLRSASPEAVFAGVELEAAVAATTEICGVRFRLVTGT